MAKKRWTQTEKYFFEGWKECVNLGSLITGDTRMEIVKRGKAA